MLNETNHEFDAFVEADNADGLNLYYMDGDGNTVYSHSYDDPIQAAQDFMGLTVQRIDPIIEGWEGNDHLDIDQDEGGCIASTECYNGSYEDMFDDLDENTGTKEAQFLRYALDVD